MSIFNTVLGGSGINCDFATFTITSRAQSLTFGTKGTAIDFIITGPVVDSSSASISTGTLYPVISFSRINGTLRATYQSALQTMKYTTPSVTQNTSGALSIMVSSGYYPPGTYYLMYTY